MPETTQPDASIGVLVVEDEAVAARAHAKYIERLEGYHVAGVAKNATQAMAALTGKILGLDPDGIDLVLLDMNLPDGHGLQVCRAIRGQRVDVDIIAVTAARDMQIVQEALSYGVAVTVCVRRAAIAVSTSFWVTSPSGQSAPRRNRYDEYASSFDLKTGNVKGLMMYCATP